MPSDAARLGVLHDTRLLDSPPERAFDRLTRLASGLIGAPTALVSLVDERRQFFKSAIGLGEPWASKRETPLSHSFCQYVARDKAPLVVEDARTDPLLAGNGATRDLGVVAYAGMPLVVHDQAVGALCVIDSSPRRWSPEQLQLLSDLAEAVVSEIELRLALREVEEQRALVSTLAGSIPRGVVLLFDRELRCAAIDGGLVRREGLDHRRLVGRHVAELARLTPDAPAFSETLAACERTLAGEVVEMDLVSPSRTLHLRTAPVRNAHGKISSGVLLALDVTVERRMQHEVRNTAQVYRAIAQNLPDAAVLLIDRDLRFVTVEGSVLERALHLPSAASLIGKTVPEVTSPANVERVLDNYRAVFGGETRKLEIARDDRFFDMTTMPLFDSEGRVSHAFVFLIDVTKRKAEIVELETARRALELQAHELREASVTDGLTGLLNRRGFSLLADKEMKAAVRAKRELLLFFVDLNGMKTINDTLGHAFGDEALAQTAKLLRGVFRSADVIARLGGDEFVVLATDALSSAAPAIGARIEEAVKLRSATPSAFELSLSVGVAVFDPAAPSTLDELLSQADAKMYAEKQRRRRGRDDGSGARTSGGGSRPSTCWWAGLGRTPASAVHRCAPPTDLKRSGGARVLRRRTLLVGPTDRRARDTCARGRLRRERRARDPAATDPCHSVTAKPERRLNTTTSKGRPRVQLAAAWSRRLKRSWSGGISSSRASSSGAGL